MQRHRANARPVACAENFPTACNLVLQDSGRRRHKAEIPQDLHPPRPLLQSPPPPPPPPSKFIGILECETIPFCCDSLHMLAQNSAPSGCNRPHLYQQVDSSSTSIVAYKSSKSLVQSIVDVTAIGRKFKKLVMTNRSRVATCQSCFGAIWEIMMITNDQSLD